MTTVIGILNKKGGVGKTSVTQLFAITSANQPIAKSVLVIDASDNKSLTFLNAYQPQELYKVVQSDVVDVPKILAAESNNYDLVFIDFPINSETNGYKTAAMCCSHFIVPTGLSITDQIVAKDTLEELQETQKLRKAAGFETNIKVLVSNVIAEKEEVKELYSALDKQKISHYEYALNWNNEIQYHLEQNQPVMDYVTEGIDWTPGQDVFHNVFIEFHKQLENA